MKHKAENETNHRTWSRICSMMGTGFQLLGEPTETRVQMVTEWMDKTQKEQQAKSIAKQIQFEAQIEIILAEKQGKDKLIEELQSSLKSYKDSDENLQSKWMDQEIKYKELMEKFEVTRQ